MKSIIKIEVKIKRNENVKHLGYSNIPYIGMNQRITTVKFFGIPIYVKEESFSE